MIFFNTLVEFQAFTAAITILLGLLGPTSSATEPVVLKELVEDMRLIETVVQILEELKRRGTGVLIVNQGISVIRTLQGVLQDKGNSTGNLRLEIQHFGTITITRSGNVQPLEGERIVGANPRSAVMSKGANAQLQAGRSNSSPLATGAGPRSTSMSISEVQEYQTVNGDGGIAWVNDIVLQFTSSQFPMFEVQGMDGNREWPPFQESDILLFNSLLDTDVGFNWDS